MKLNSNKILEHRGFLENHSLLVTNTIQTIDDLRIFMENHVYAVWDFMSLIKSLQQYVVPSGQLWIPTKGTRSDIARLINEIVLAEETDISMDGKSSISHFDLYLQAMMEIGADVGPIRDYLNRVENTGAHWGAPEPAGTFVDNTFSAIRKGPHCVAASFCYGRETVIPAMFKKILRQLNLNKTNAPKFYYYLERHIHIDGEEHGPMSEKLVEYFCDNDLFKIHEAELAAIAAITSRIQFFDKIEEKLNR